MGSSIIGQFWGTSDANAVPSPFCECEVCREAREKGGKYMRTRSSFRLSEDVMIDLGIDAIPQSMKYGNLIKLKHILYTHTHEDHLNPHIIMMLNWNKQNLDFPINYYFTEDAYNIVSEWKKTEWIIKGKVGEIEKEGMVKFHKLEYGKKYKISDFEVVPFKGKHIGNMKETSAMYLVTLPNGKTLFYGLDSGRYFDETIDALKNYKIDIFISEATFGVDKKCEFGMHQNMHEVCDLMQTLYKQGTVTDDTKLYLTHISHRSSFDDMQKAIFDLKFPIETALAYDGLKIL